MTLSSDEQQQSGSLSLEVTPHIGGGGNDEFRVENSPSPFNWRIASLALMAIAVLGGSVYMLSGPPGDVPQKPNPIPSQPAAAALSTGSGVRPKHDLLGGPLAMVKDPLTTRVVSGIRKNPVLAFGLVATALLGLGVAYYLLFPPGDSTVEDPEKPKAIVNLTWSDLEKTKDDSNQTDEPNLDKDDSEKSTFSWLLDLAFEYKLVSGLIAIALVVLVILAIRACKKSPAIPVAVKTEPTQNIYYSVNSSEEKKLLTRDFYINSDTYVATLILPAGYLANLENVQLNPRSRNWQYFLNRVQKKAVYSCPLSSVDLKEVLDLTLVYKDKPSKVFELKPVSLTNYDVENAYPGTTFTVDYEKVARLTVGSIVFTNHPVISLDQLRFVKGADGLWRLFLDDTKAQEKELKISVVSDSETIEIIVRKP